MPTKSGKNGTLQKRRTILENTARYLTMPHHIDVKQITVENIIAEWLQPVVTINDRVVLYLHGGAYTMGSCTTHRALASRIAKSGNTPVLLPEFRLAPEFPFPAALEDCLGVYRWVIERGISHRKIVIAGDSSGGGLAIALTALLKNKNIPLPAAVICLSPWVDLELTGESITTNAAIDPICKLEESKYHANQYTCKHNARNPLISPIYTDMHEFPPMLIQAGDREILLSDAVRLTERARKDGVEAELEVWDGMWHVWHLLAGYVPEGQRAINKIGAFIHKHLD